MDQTTEKERGLDPIRLADKVAMYERQYVFEVLERFGGNRTATARALCISLRWLQHKLRTWQSEGHVVPASSAVRTAALHVVRAAVLGLCLTVTAWAHGAGPSAGPGPGAPAGAPAGAPGAPAGAPGAPAGAPGEDPRIGAGQIRPGGRGAAIPVQTCLPWTNYCLTVYRMPRAQALTLDAHQACNTTGDVVLERVGADGRFTYRAASETAARAYRACFEARGFRF